MSGAVLSGADLSGAVLTDVDLSNANFDGSNLEGLDFSNVKGKTASFKFANLKAATFSNTAPLSGYYFSDANLEDADLTYAKFTDCVFSDANLKNALVGPNTEFNNVNFGNTNLLIDTESTEPTTPATLHMFAPAPLDCHAFWKPDGSKIVWDRLTQWELPGGTDDWSVADKIKSIDAYRTEKKAELPEPPTHTTQLHLGADIIDDTTGRPRYDKVKYTNLMDYETLDKEAYFNAVVSATTGEPIGGVWARRNRSYAVTKNQVKIRINTWLQRALEAHTEAVKWVDFRPPAASSDGITLDEKFAQAQQTIENAGGGVLPTAAEAAVLLAAVGNTPPPASDWVLEVYSIDEEQPTILKDDFQFFYNLPGVQDTISDFIFDFTSAALQSTYDKFFAGSGEGASKRVLSLDSQNDIIVQGYQQSDGQYSPFRIVEDANNDNNAIEMKNVVVFYNLDIHGTGDKLKITNPTAVLFNDCDGAALGANQYIKAVTSEDELVHYIDLYADFPKVPDIWINGLLRPWPGFDVAPVVDTEVGLISLTKITNITFKNGEGGALTTISELPLNTYTVITVPADAAKITVTNNVNQTYTASILNNDDVKHPPPIPTGDFVSGGFTLNPISDDEEATGTVTISTTDNVVKTGTTLTAQVGASDTDGAIVSYQYVWKAGGVTLQTTSSTATTDQYTVGSDLVGQEITCEVTTTDENDGETTISSSGVTVVDQDRTKFVIGCEYAGGVDVDERVNGPKSGETITTSVTFEDPDLSAAAQAAAQEATTFVWTRPAQQGGTDDQVSVTSSYTIVGADLGKTLTVTATVTPSDGTQYTHTKNISVSNAEIHNYKVTVDVDSGKFVISPSGATTDQFNLKSFILDDDYVFDVSDSSISGHTFELVGMNASGVKQDVGNFDSTTSTYQHRTGHPSELYVHCATSGHGFGMGSTYNRVHTDATKSFENFVLPSVVTAVPGLPTGIIAKNSNDNVIAGVELAVAYYNQLSGGSTFVPPAREPKRPVTYWSEYSVVGTSVKSIIRQAIHHTNRNQHKNIQHALTKPGVSVDADTIDEAVNAISTATTVSATLKSALKTKISEGLTRVGQAINGNKIRLPTIKRSDITNVFAELDTYIANQKSEKMNQYDSGAGDGVSDADKKKHKRKLTADFAKSKVKAMFDMINEVAGEDNNNVTDVIKAIEVTKDDIFGLVGDQIPDRYKHLKSDIKLIAPSTGSTTSIQETIPAITEQFVSDGLVAAGAQRAAADIAAAAAFAGSPPEPGHEVKILAVPYVSPERTYTIPTKASLRAAASASLQAQGASKEDADAAVADKEPGETITIDLSDVIKLFYDELQSASTYVPLLEVGQFSVQKLDFGTDAAPGPSVKITTTLTAVDDNDSNNNNYSLKIEEIGNGITIDINGSSRGAGTYTDLSVDGNLTIVNGDKRIVKVLGTDANGTGTKPDNAAITPDADNYIGQQLTCTPPSADGTTYDHTFQWKRDNALISGVTASTYTLVAADCGKQITCTVSSTVTNIENATPWVTDVQLSDKLPKITSVAAAAQVGDQNTKLDVALSGDTLAGDKFVITIDTVEYSCSIGIGSGDDRAVQLSVGNFAPALTAFKSGSHSCKIKRSGNIAAASFNSTSFPDNDAQKDGDIIGSNCTVGTQITAINTAITDVEGIADPTGYSHKWQYLDADGDWQDITGKTDQTFTPTLAQYGKQIRVVVTTTDSNNGTTIIESQASTVGDPYVTAANGKVSKLPDQHGFYRMFEHADMFVNVEVDSKDIGEEMAQYCKTYGISHDEPEYKNHRIVTHGYWNRNVWIESEGNTFELDLFTKQMTFEQNYFKYNIVKDNFQYNMDLADKTITRSLHIKWIHSRYGLQSIVIDFYANPQVMNGIRMVSGLLWSSKSTGMLVKNYKPKLMSLKRLTDNKSGKLAKKLGKTSSTLHSKPIMARGEIWTRGTTKKKIVKRRK